MGLQPPTRYHDECRALHYKHKQERENEEQKWPTITSAVCL
jgi:hypothetical protein